jgi:hypothetical protein
MKTPETLEDIEAMVANAIPESEYLDYKDQRSLDALSQNLKPPPPGFHKAQHEAIAELTRDVSAFANSDGGVLIYGVSEDEQTHLPAEINTGFPNDGKLSKERLSDLIDSGVSPRIAGLRIIPIRRSNTHSLFVIDVPRSSRAPHQAQDGACYRRYNFSNRRMSGYELREAFQARRLESPRLIAISLSTESILVRIEVENVGLEPAKDVSFHASPEFTRWLEEKPRSILKNGAKVFLPGAKHVFHGDIAPDILSGKSRFPRAFSIEASYFSPLSQERVSELFEFDIGDLEGSGVIQTDMEKLIGQVRELTKSFRTEMPSMRRAIEKVANQSIVSRVDRLIETGVTWWRKNRKPKQG